MDFPLVPKAAFDAYALALPYGLDYGDGAPIAAYENSERTAWAAITHCEEDGTFGVVSMRQRIDRAWKLTLDRPRGFTLGEAEAEAAAVIEDVSRLPLQPGEARRHLLVDVEGRQCSQVFASLAQQSHHGALWMLNQLYTSMPNPDKNWATGCQTQNFHTRIWEAQLFAALREQGLLVKQDHTSPDFYVENRAGDGAWIEAVTANPEEPYEHYGATPSKPPSDLRVRFMGPAAVRFAKTIGSKLQRKYHELPHVKGHPFAIAISDFHAPSSMVWSREALQSYLYGEIAKIETRDGRSVAVAESITHLLGASAFPAGLFCNDEHAELSAVLFTNACSIAKLDRVAASSGFNTKVHRYTRYGEFFDRTPGALKGIPFCFDVTSLEYKNLWPDFDREPWCAELEVFHNPYARYPIPRSQFPGAQHWVKVGSDIVCRAHFQISILKSKTVVTQVTDRPLTLSDVMIDHHTEVDPSAG